MLRAYPNDRPTASRPPVSCASRTLRRSASKSGRAPGIGLRFFLTVCSWLNTNPQVMLPAAPPPQPGLEKQRPGCDHSTAFHRHAMKCRCSFGNPAILKIWQAPRSATRRSRRTRSFPTPDYSGCGFIVRLLRSHSGVYLRNSPSDKSDLRLGFRLGLRWHLLTRHWGELTDAYRRSERLCQTTPLPRSERRNRGTPSR